MRSSPSGGIARRDVVCCLFNLVSQKDMVGQAQAQQITLPIMTLLGAIAIFFDYGVDGVLLAFVVTWIGIVGGRPKSGHPTAHCCWISISHFD